MSGLSRALLSSASPVPNARDFAVPARTLRSSPAGRSNDRKNSSLVITLAGSLTASGSCGFRFPTRSGNATDQRTVRGYGHYERGKDRGGFHLYFTGVRTRTIQLPVSRFLRLLDHCAAIVVSLLSRPK
jgi:hypothetical protein